MNVTAATITRHHLDILGRAARDAQFGRLAPATWYRSADLQALRDGGLITTHDLGTRYRLTSAGWGLLADRAARP